MDVPPPEGPADDQHAEIRRVIGEVAHELSRPLAAVLSYAELALLDPDLPEPTRARLAKVLEHAEECRQVVLHSLEIATAPRRSDEPVDLNAVVERAAASLALVMRRTGARLDFDFAPDLPRVAGSARELEAAARNLLENALEASARPRPGASPPRVRVATEAAASGVRLTVEDNGPGLDPAVADRVFEPFVSTKAVGQATGLGLAIVRRIARDHGGRVTAESLPDGGARFTLETPGVASSNFNLAPPSAALEAALPRALLIDDDTTMRELLAAYLQTLGYESAQVGDGEEGLREALASDFGVIICDVKMPNMDGLEFHRRLRAAAPDRARRVVFSSGVLPSDPAADELRALPNAWLRKPYHLAALKTALDATGCPPGAPAPPRPVESPPPTLQ